VRLDLRTEDAGGGARSLGPWHGALEEDDLGAAEGEGLGRGAAHDPPADDGDPHVWRVPHPAKAASGFRIPAERRLCLVNPMRHTALTQHPDVTYAPFAMYPEGEKEREREELALDAEPPRESVTRLISAHDVSVAHTRPTTPVPSDYLFLSQHMADEGGAHVLALRLESLGTEQAEDPTWAANDNDPAHAEESEEAAKDPRASTIVPRRLSVAPHLKSRMPSLLASIALVPYLRMAPRDISRGTIDHGAACVLALVDGRTSIEQILDTSPMPVPRVLRILSELLERGIVGLKD
jgi:hypothetical protein